MCTGVHGGWALILGTGVKTGFLYGYSGWALTNEIPRQTWEQGGQLSKRKIMNPTRIGSFQGTESNDVRLESVMG